MLHAPIAPTVDPREIARLSQTVPCVGFLVLTAITDKDGRTTYQHSPIYRSEAQADEVCRKGMRKLEIWEREMTRTVQTCSTAFPLADVLAGIATREDDYWADRRAA